MMSPRRKILIGIGAFIAISIIAITIAIIYRVTQGPLSSNIGEQTITVDETTGEQIIETVGQTEEALTNRGIVTLGFSRLIDYGVGSFQVELVNNSLDAYAEQQGNDLEIKRISLDPKNLTFNLNQETGESVITGEIVINQDKRQKITFSYMGTNDMLITINDKETDIQLYTSSLDGH